MPAERDPPLPTAVHLALQDGRFIEAVKLLRESTGCDLATAKGRIERATAADPLLRERLAVHGRALRKKVAVGLVVFEVLTVLALLLWWFAR
jgi:hypothetical protein